MDRPDIRPPTDLQLHNERTPLVKNISPSEQHDQTIKLQELAEETPLPKFTMLLLFLARCAFHRGSQAGQFFAYHLMGEFRFAEPLGFCILFPFVNQ